MSETILAVVACCAMLAAFMLAAFAYRLNEKWAEKEVKWLEIAKKQNKVLDEQGKLLDDVICTSKKQNKLTERMSEEWVRLYYMMKRESIMIKEAQDDEI